MGINYKCGKGAYLGHFEFIDVVEAFLEMGLHCLWVLGLAENFQQIVVGQEVESGENLSLRLEIHVQGFLNLFQFDVHAVQVF